MENAAGTDVTKTEKGLAFQAAVQLWELHERQTLGLTGFVIDTYQSVGGTAAASEVGMAAIKKQRLDVEEVVKAAAEYTQHVQRWATAQVKAVMEEVAELAAEDAFRHLRP